VARRQELVTACFAYAQSAVAEVPISGHRWLALAKMAANLHEREVFNHGLQRSRLTSPASNALASERLILAEKRFAWLDDGSRNVVNADIATLILDRPGTQFLAELYRSRPGIRETITRVVETMPDERQRLFLQLFKQVSEASR
jgi:hypothetical protein